MRARPALSALVLAAGCGGVEAPCDTCALGFDGPPSVASTEVDEAPPGELTVEAWVRADAKLSWLPHPLVSWEGAFSLYEDPDGTGHFADPDGVGASGPTSWMDGVLHHVAATWDSATGETVLYVDGRRVGFHVGASPGDGGPIRVGWDGGELHHEGIVDEVRISSTVRYDGDFDPPDGPFEPDGTTLHLWHADGGEGDFAIDEERRADLVLESVEWVPFDLASEIAGDER